MVLRADRTGAHRVAFDKNPDYDIYVQTDAEARRVAQSIMNNK